VVNLAKFAINVCASGAREVLPVLVLEGRPVAVVGYAAKGGGVEASVTVFDGEEKRAVRVSEVLNQLKESGALFGYVEVQKG